MHIILSYFATCSLMSLAFRLAIPGTILMALYKGYEYVEGLIVGVFS